MKQQVLSLASEKKRGAQDCVKDTSKRWSAIEEDSHKLNIRIDGLTEDKNENSEQTQHKVQTLLINKMFLSVGLDCANCIGALETSNGSGSRNKLRTVLAKLTKMDHAQIFKNRSKLNGTTIFLNEDLFCLHCQYKKKKCLELLKKCKQGYIAYFVGCDMRFKRETLQLMMVLIITTKVSIPKHD